MIHRGELLAELCAQRRLIADRGDPRQDDHGRDVRLGAARARRRPGLLPRRRAARRRTGRRGRQRRLGRGRVGRRRGRRERRQLPQAAARDRGDHQPRARPPLALGLARRAAEAFADFAAPATRWSPAPTSSSPGRSGSGSSASRSSPNGQPAARPSCSRPRSGRSPAAAAASAPRRRHRRRGRPRVPGRHNVPNALAALGGLSLAGSTPRLRRGARASFPGVARRIELKGERNGARIYDDYAHHPTEVAATLEAARELGPRRLIAAFQPHLYSRTKALAAGVRRGAGRGRRGRGARRLPGARAAGGRARGRQRPDGRRGGRRPCRRPAGLVAARRRARPPQALAPAARARATC